MEQRLEYAIQTLRLAQPFRIAHGTSQDRRSVFVKIGEARGEGALVPYYPWTAEECEEWLRALAPEHLTLELLPDGPAPARTAVEMALIDLEARRQSQTVIDYWGISSESSPTLTRTLSIPESLDALRDRLETDTFDGFSMLKIKVGSGNLDFDEAIIRLVREKASQALALDANCAWTPQETANILKRCAHCRIEVLEQPVSRDSLEPWQELHGLLSEDHPLLIADESIQTPDDILALRGLADGINVKLLKTRGLQGAKEWIELARSLEMKVMVGTMVESVIGCTAAAQFSGWADFMDIDIFQDITNDAHSGISLENGTVLYPSGAGLGITQPQPISWH